MLIQEFALFLNNASGLVNTMFVQRHQNHSTGIAITKQRGSVDILLYAKVIVVLLLLVWIAFSLASLFWRLFPAPMVDSNDLVAVNTAFEPESATRTRAVDIEALKAIPLFGKEVAPVPVVEEQPEAVQENVEETRLNLTLVGSFANEIDDKKAYAIIANGRNQVLYKVDEDIEGLNNVSLLKVFADKVIINNRGNQEALMMYPEGGAKRSTTNSTAQVSQFVEREAPAAAPAEGNAAQALASLNDRQRLQKISDVIRFTRKTENGQMIGFRVLPGRNRAGFEQTGLQLNDVVTAIDGSELNNLRAANEIYREKRNATQASLTVLRDGSELTVDLDLNSINLN